MKLFPAFLKLVRWPNLGFIVVTQLLFYYCILVPSFENNGFYDYKLSPTLLVILIASSVLIAAAGYIINDYFDLNIDQVNKPQAIVIQRIIKRRWAILWHLSFSILGVILAFYISWKINNYLIGFANLLCVFLLWLYSTTFKRKLLIGNVIISLLTAWVILVLYFCEVNIYLLKDPAYTTAIRRIFKFSIIYAGFAFIVSLIREAVKDMEDIEGDGRYGCKTMPIVWGVQVSKIYVLIWLIIVIICLLILQAYAVILTWWGGIIYCLLFILLPFFKIIQQLNSAYTNREYHKVSTMIKLAMLTGILSMLFFLYYSR